MRIWLHWAQSTSLQIGWIKIVKILIIGLFANRFSGILSVFYLEGGEPPGRAKEPYIMKRNGLAKKRVLGISGRIFFEYWGDKIKDVCQMLV